MEQIDLDTAAVDEQRLAGLEQDLADAAATIESIEEITRGPMGAPEKISAIDALVAGGRFAVGDAQI